MVGSEKRGEFALVAALVAVRWERLRFRRFRCFARLQSRAFFRHQSLPSRVRQLIATIIVTFRTLPAAPDTLVVCPDALRSALAPWESYRHAQGHVLAVIEPPTTAEAMHAAIRQAAGGGRLKYVVLVGDVPAVPTEYAEAKINVRWGSEPTIATDELYADVDGDTLADVAVGRIPVDSPAELHTVVRKLLRYEQNADQGSWRRQLDVVAGVGGFGPLTDALIEAAGRSVFQQVVPTDYTVRQLPADPDADLCTDQRRLVRLDLSRPRPAEHARRGEHAARRAVDSRGGRRAAAAMRRE